MGTSTIPAALLFQCELSEETCLLGGDPSSRCRSTYSQHHSDGGRRKVLLLVNVRLFYQDNLPFNKASKMLFVLLPHIFTFTLGTTIHNPFKINSGTTFEIRS